jgi:S1-C subfamily serine protease
MDKGALNPPTRPRRLWHKAFAALLADRGFQPGDIILEVGRKAVSTSAEVSEDINGYRAPGKNGILLRVQSKGRTTLVTLPVGLA